jgi:hypothetical protein
MDFTEKKEKILQLLRERKTEKFRTIVYRREEPQTTWRYFFEPFVGLFYYFGGLNFFEYLSWLVWLGIFFFLRKLVFSSSLRREVAVFSLLLAISLLLFAQLNHLVFPPGNLLIPQVKVAFSALGMSGIALSLIYLMQIIRRRKKRDVFDG